MVITQGWICIHDISDAGYDLIEEGKKKIGFSLEYRVVNTVGALQIYSCHNHFGGLEKSIVNLFRELSKEICTESFGLLYIFDEEGLNGFLDEFEVYKINKNKMVNVKDEFFSPYSEKIADYSEHKDDL